MRYKNFWILLIMLLTGIVLGGFIGQLAEGEFRTVLRVRFTACDQFRDSGYYLWPDHQDHDGQHHRRRGGADHLPLDLTSFPDNVLGEVRS